MKVEFIRPESRSTEEFRMRVRNAGRRALVAGATLAASLAGGLAKSETLRIVPSVALTETYSDNVALVAGELARSGWVTELAPGIRAELSGARVKGFLDYRLQGSTYSSESQLNRTQRYLNSFAKVEAVENLLFVDARADINQQNRSAFGAAVDPGLSTPSANRVETTSYQVAPYIRGHLSDIASYQLRVKEMYVREDDIALPITRATEWVAKIGNASRSAKLGWAVDANALSLRNDVVGTLEDSRIRGSLIYAFNPQIHVSVSEGHETTDFAGPPRRGTSTPGAGLEWSPTVRTQLSAIYEKRFFGNGHVVAFSHRTPLSAWRLFSTKDVAVLPNQLASGGLGAIEILMSDLLTSAIPDPEARAQEARRRLEESGISGSSALTSNVLTSRPFIFRNSVASVALLGATNTITLTASWREQRGFGVAIAGEGSILDDDFRQRGFNANLAHRLTPLTSVILSAASLRTDDLTITTRQTTQKSLSLVVSSRIGPKTSASLGIRYVDFDSSIALESYRENAIFGSVSIRM